MWNNKKTIRLGVLIGALAAGTLGLTSTAAASAPPAPKPGPAVVSAMWTSTYGSVLVVGGSGPLAGAPLYGITSDALGMFGCNPTPVEKTLFGPTTCTGPESDIFNNVMTDEWPALNTTGAPIAGPGVDRHLLG